MPWRPQNPQIAGLASPHPPKAGCSLSSSCPCSPALNQGGLLSVNFSPALLSMSAEVVQWERLRMAVPYVAMEIQAQRDKYRSLREHALALVGGGREGRV